MAVVGALAGEGAIEASEGLPLHLIILAGVGFAGFAYLMANPGKRAHGKHRPDDLVLSSDYNERASGLGQGQKGGAGHHLGTHRHVPEHLQRYGTGPYLPTHWSRHRMAYARRPQTQMEKMQELPINHPAFPRNDLVWMYNPPAEQDV